MNTELIGIIVSFLLTVLLAYPLGKYFSKVYSGEKTALDFTYSDGYTNFTMPVLSGHNMIFIAR